VFEGSGRPLTDDGVGQACEVLGVSASEVWAVISVETRGFGFLRDRRPQVLFERHWFRRYTGGRFDADRPDLSAREPGGYVGGEGEHDRLREAIALDRRGALLGTSWGIGQVMGFNHRHAGHPDVESMVDAMVCDEDQQLLAMAGFIKSQHLDSPLRRLDWEAFALGYNGKNFRRHHYHRRLATAHATYREGLPDLALRTAQAALIYLRYDPGPVDGVQGRRTRAALQAFQEAVGLPLTGALDDETAARLREAAFPAPPPPAVAGRSSVEPVATD